MSTFCVSSSSPRSICEVDDTAALRRTGRQVDFWTRRRRSLLSNIRGRAPCRVAGNSPRANTASGQRKQEIRCTRYARDATASPILRIASPRSPSARTRVWCQSSSGLWIIFARREKLDPSPSFARRLILQIRLKKLPTFVHRFKSNNRDSASDLALSPREMKSPNED